MSIKKMKDKIFDKAWEENKSEYLIKLEDLFEILDFEERDKIIVPEWFDDWYKTFDGDKEKASYHIMRCGYGHLLKDGYGVGTTWSKKLERAFGKGDDYENKKAALKAIENGYEVKQEPKYYARYKSDLVDFTGEDYLYETGEKFYLEYKNCADEKSKKEWNSLGVNDTNAVFEEVSE